MTTNGIRSFTVTCRITPPHTDARCRVAAAGRDGTHPIPIGTAPPAVLPGRSRVGPGRRVPPPALPYRHGGAGPTARRRGSRPAPARAAPRHRPGRGTGAAGRCPVPPAAPGCPPDSSRCGQTTGRLPPSPSLIRHPCASSIHFVPALPVRPEPVVAVPLLTVGGGRWTARGTGLPVAAAPARLPARRTPLRPCPGPTGRLRRSSGRNAVRRGHPAAVPRAVGAPPGASVQRHPVLQGVAGRAQPAGAEPAAGRDRCTAVPGGPVLRHAAKLRPCGVEVRPEQHTTRLAVVPDGSGGGLVRAVSAPIGGRCAHAGLPVSGRWPVGRAPGLAGRPLPLGAPGTIGAFAPRIGDGARGRTPLRPLCRRAAPAAPGAGWRGGRREPVVAAPGRRCPARRG